MRRLWRSIQEAWHLYKRGRRLEHRLALKTRRQLLRAQITASLASSVRQQLVAQRQVLATTVPESLQDTWRAHHREELEAALRAATTGSSDRVQEELRRRLGEAAGAAVRSQADLGVDGEQAMREVVGQAKERLSKVVDRMGPAGAGSVEAVAAASGAVEELASAASPSAARQMLMNRVIESAKELDNPQEALRSAMAMIGLDKDSSTEGKQLREALEEQLSKR